MIVTRTETINGRAFAVTTSDSGYMIERDGVMYADAYDPEGRGRVYTETDEPVEAQDISAEEALDIILGGGGV